jgi:hypothetical protein
MRANKLKLWIGNNPTTACNVRIMLLQPEQIERIISAVGEPYCGNPHRDALRGELEGIIYVWEYLSSAHSPRDAREKQKQFTAIASHGSKFRETLIQSDRKPAYYADGILKAETETTSEDVEAASYRFMETLQRIVTAAKSNAEKFQNLATHRLLDRSPNDWLAGDRLPIVFERHFPRSAAVSIPSGKTTPDGPFIRFAVAVFDEIGTPISPHTVARALKDDVRDYRTNLPAF